MACKACFWGAKNIILWCQGVVPEESYLRNRSRARTLGLSFIERRALKKAAFCLFVSDEMRRHYEKKYRLDFEDRYFVMPCFNASLEPEAFCTEGKYVSPSFAYVGSLAAWQCFEKTVDIYKAIEARLDDTRLKVLTFDQDRARMILEARGVERYEVSCVPPEKVAAELAEVSYGFVIREDNVVNRVATPTKLSSYMSAGVIPVFSDCLGSFTDMARNLRFAVPVGESVNADYVARCCAESVSWKEILAEYRCVFDTYYSREYYVERLAPLFDKALSLGRRA